MSFRLKEIEFTVEETEDVVKADKILTLFMINTLADNARKFTDNGGNVKISSHSAGKYVEISIADTGKGIEENKLANLFNNKTITNEAEDTGQVSTAASHGFGLANCIGIINKYKKTSRLFDVCMIAAESRKGKGSRFYFRLPKGIAKVIMCLLFSSAWYPLHAVNDALGLLDKASVFADSVYQCNIDGKYAKALEFADSSREYINKHYIETYHPKDTGALMKREGNITETAPEIKWFQDGVETNYDIILSIRNESAIAALALHKWMSYRYNNKVYTQLFKEVTADRQLEEYCRIMQKSETNKNVAIVILSLLFLMIFPSYYFLYYRHHLHFRFCIEQVRHINDILLDSAGAAEKLKDIQTIKNNRFPQDLQDIVTQIKDALEKSIGIFKIRHTNIELVKDECRRAQYESERLYVCNNVLDNSLSTLKHETMYYPSRIRQLVDSQDKDIGSITEVASYYKEIYSILSVQAMRQVEMIKTVCRPVRLSAVIKEIDSDVTVLGDEIMLGFLFEILQKENGKERLSVIVQEKDGNYIDLHVRMTSLNITQEQCSGLFYPDLNNLQYLVCRQIIRDMGEASNMRGCGIFAALTENGTEIVITLARYKQ